jgi:hypothetical protein
MRAQPVRRPTRWPLPSVVVALAVWAAACSGGVGSDARIDAGGKERMHTSQVSASRPPIDLAAATEFETATFALG